MSAPLLEIRDLSLTYRSSGRTVTALDGVGLAVAPGETVALVGASGSGKTTLARAVLRLVEPDAGTIRFNGEDWLGLRGGALRRRRRQMQMVFQDPLAAFNPRATVTSAIASALRLHRIAPEDEIGRRIGALLDRVELAQDLAGRSVLELSGGQRQRVAIARALACEPDLIVLDEAVSALDVSIRAQVLNLLMELQRERGIAYLFVSHDIAVVRAVAHRICVMEAGRIVEEGPAAAVVDAPRSDAARRLVAAVPRLPADVLQHALPDPGDPP